MTKGVGGKQVRARDMEGLEVKHVSPEYELLPHGHDLTVQALALGPSGHPAPLLCSLLPNPLS